MDELENATTYKKKRNKHRFSVSGEIASDIYMVQTKESLLHNVLNLMRDQGYIPDLDTDHEFVIQWSQDESYHFEYAVWGVYVGKARAWESEGWTRGQILPRHTRENKSEASS